MGSFPALEMEVESDFTAKNWRRKIIWVGTKYTYVGAVPISQGHPKKKVKKVPKKMKKTSVTFGAKGKALKILTSSEPS